MQQQQQQQLSDEKNKEKLSQTMLRARDKMNRAWYGKREEKRERDRERQRDREGQRKKYDGRNKKKCYMFQKSLKNSI